MTVPLKDNPDSEYSRPLSPLRKRERRTKRSTGSRGSKLGGTRKSVYVTDC